MVNVVVAVSLYLSAGFFICSVILKKVTFPIFFTWQGKEYKGKVNPTAPEQLNGMPKYYRVTLNDMSFGNISCTGDGWIADRDHPQELVNMVGRAITLWYQ